MTPKECEAKFQVELANYRQTGNSKSWENIWICVQECCSNTIKSKAKGLVIPDFDGKVTDSVIKVMEKIQSGTDPKRLSSFCYLYVIGVIYNRKLQKEERNFSYEQWQEYQYNKENQ
jgi:hypothetical protein